VSASLLKFAPSARASLAALATAAVACGLLACGPAPPPENRVTIMQLEAPLTMDAEDHTASFTMDVLDPMYESLVRFDQNLNVAPSLATKWSVDPSGTRWTLELRKGVRFHDGTPFDAQAVVDSFQRLLDPARGLAAASRVRGIVKRVTATGPDTVLFTLTSSYASFLRVLAVTPIVSPLAEKQGKLSREAVGTGPYKFREWKTGEYVLEERNEQYWGPRPTIKQLKWIWTSEPVLINMSVLAGAADIVNPLPPIFAEALSRNRKVQLIQGEEARVFWVALNNQSKPLDDVRVRQALNYATDREALVRTQLRGFGTPANSPLAPADFAYDAQTRGYPYDLERAKVLLAKAGYSNGFTIKIAVQEQDSQLVETLQGMWANVHVNLQIDQMESGVFSQAIFGSPKQKAQQGIDCVYASWASDNTDPDYQLGPLYRSDQWSPAGANLGFYSNPQLDVLLESAAGELNVEKRKELYRQAQQIISDDAPHVLLYYARDVAAQHVGTVPTPVRLLPGGRVEFEGPAPAGP
jgi:glutathione transport system substrate-binding protein